jgi:general secretion pathway protein D
MKTKLLAFVLVFTGLALWAQTPAAPGMPNVNTQRRLPRFGNTNGPMTPPRFAPPGAVAAPAVNPNDPAQSDEIIPANMINWQGVELNQVLEIYADLVGRTLIRGQLPDSKIVLKTKTPLTKREVIQAIQAVLALNGVAVINIGEKFVKVLPVDQANAAGAELDETSRTNLPNLGSYITHITQLHYVKPSAMVPFIQPFAKLQGGLQPLDDNGILVMRDYAENIKRMLEMIDKIDVSVPAEFISEVIPIRYAEANDIASALNSLGGSGGATVSFGSSGTAGGSINGMRGGTTGGGISGMGGGMGGLGSSGGYSGGFGGGIGGASRPFGSTTATTPGGNGTPTGGSSFAQRLQNIVNRASGTTGGGGGQDQIQLFGTTKIIADQRSNSLLVFATRADMERIKEVIGKLDVLLAQVLIESIIMDVGIGNDLNAGVSAIQHPRQFNNSNIAGGGLANNGGGAFLNFIRNAATNGAVNALPTNSTGGLSYFASIGDTWDVAVHAAESDNHASIIQRPRIQTSQAKPAQFFVGQTVPYVTSTYNNAYSGGYGGSSYSQLSVGVELDVTPYINPDGLVVMDINQEIDEISGYTQIDGNNVPNTVKRTLSSEIAVRNRDTIILGGFVQVDKSNTKSGIPVLQNIPLLGWLFSSHEAKNDRTELMVMMRPTVLKTPELAAAQTIKEAQRLPGVSAAAAENAEDERTLIEAEKKKELKRAKSGKPADGFFNLKPEVEDTNAPANDFGSAPGAAAVPATPPPVQTAADLQQQTAELDKARAALEEKMKQLDTPPAPAPAPPQ